ncbi:MAG: histidinol-phosphate transaminase [Oscillospiraceae bacterium]
MSRFLSQKHAALTPYTPGEQPRDMQYTKLNTNESPFAPSDAVRAAVAAESERLQLYCDPECTALREKAAALYGVKPENILPVNGSDEILYFAFLAFGDEEHPIAFPDISYGFYPVYAEMNHIPAHIIPLKEDFSLDPNDYIGLNETIIIANPNAPTGRTISVADIERIVQSNPNNVVIIDEAYVDFGGESCVPLIETYDNLLVTQTFSKSRSLAGARLGFGIGPAALIRDLNTIKYSTNPYNVNRMTQAAGCAAIDDNDYYLKNAQTIMENRAYTTAELEKLGFEVLPSKANFLFARRPDISGFDLYAGLKARGVLVRHFAKDRIADFVRITIGTRAQMDILLDSIRAILNERGLKS